jgi:hypothetical protein
MGLAFGAMAIGFSAAAAKDDQGAAQRGNGIEGSHGERMVEDLSGKRRVF